MTARPPKITELFLCVLGLANLYQAVLFGDRKMTHTWKALIILLAAIIIASTTHALASDNTLGSVGRGEGAGSISGYSVSNITYRFASDPTKIDSVIFTLDGNASSVKIKLNDSASNWYPCSLMGGHDWNCQTTGATIKSAETLRVFAAGE
jgi:hypothetical protein